jgi:purine-binding chemotaxis protein CheW
MDGKSTTRELISITVGGQLFALDIMSVREIRGWTTSTPLPHAPAYVLGMINLRGTVLPVLDLACFLTLPPCTPDKSSVVVVANINDQPVGLLVDAVCDIINVQDSEIQNPPDMGGNQQGVVRGVVTIGESIVTLLELSGAVPDLQPVAA